MNIITMMMKLQHVNHDFSFCLKHGNPSKFVNFLLVLDKQEPSSGCCHVERPVGSDGKLNFILGRKRARNDSLECICSSSSCLVLESLSEYMSVGSDRSESSLDPGCEKENVTNYITSSH